MNFLKTLLWQRPWIPLALTLIAAAMTGRHAEANPLDMPDKRWHNDIAYYTHSACDDTTLERVNEAATEVSRYSVDVARVGTYNDYDRDNRNTIGCAPDSPFTSSLRASERDGAVYTDQDLTAISDDGKLFTLGTTRTWHYPETGEIIEFDIWLNSTWMIIDDMAWQTIRHEWGHALGLSHSARAESLMASSGGHQHWDAETIGRLALSYERCEARIDDRLNLWLPSLTVEGRDVYAVMPAGAEWPVGVRWFGDAQC